LFAGIYGEGYGQKKVALSKYLTEANEYLQVGNYSKAAELYASLKGFKKDRPYALQGLVYCYAKLKDYKALEGIKKELGSNEAMYILIEGMLQERNGNKPAAKENYELFLSKSDEKYGIELKDIAIVGLGRMKTPEEDETRNKNIKVTASSLVLNDVYTGGTWHEQSLVFSYGKIGMPTGSNFQKIEGYMGSLSNKSSGNINTKFYLGGISVDENRKEVIVSKQLNEENGFGSLKPKAFKKATLSSKGINTMQLFGGKQINGLNASELTKLDFCDKEYNYVHPVIFGNGTKMIFSSDMAGSLGGYDLYISERKSDGSWGSPRNLGSQINSAGDEMYPSVFKDSVLYYSSTGLPGYGNADVYYSLYVRGEFQEPINIGKDINSGADELGFIMVDKRKGLFFSNRENAQQDKLFYLEYPVKYRKMRGTAKDKLYDVPLSDVKIEIFDREKDSLLATVSSNDEGKFAFNYLLEDKEYRIVASKQGFKSTEKIIKPGSTDVFLEYPNLFNMEPIIEKKTVFRFNNILFDYGKADLKDSSKIILDRLAEVLLNNPKVKVELSAHTDSRGSDVTNLKLSQRRAESCVNYLIMKGVNSINIVSRGYGETQPLNRCTNNVKCTEDEFAINRRVEIKVLDVKFH
jgi:outer membrane protein OmpA-like peptidoglycan-associated protein